MMFLLIRCDNFAEIIDFDSEHLISMKPSILDPTVLLIAGEHVQCRTWSPGTESVSDNRSVQLNHSWL